ncbi:unnamed protein product [Dicrocoelium dendriticum]|nr:unnamed protein product [Dicrocoelium dendriticum]
MQVGGGGGGGGGAGPRPLRGEAGQKLIPLREEGGGGGGGGGGVRGGGGGGGGGGDGGLAQLLHAPRPLGQTVVSTQVRLNDSPFLHACDLMGEASKSTISVDFRMPPLTAAAKALMDGLQFTDQMDEGDPRLDRCSWRFNPWLMATTGSTGSCAERMRIPDPTMTLFQLHCWLLERCEREAGTLHQQLKDTDDPSLEHQIVNSQNKEEPVASLDSDRLPPPPDDWFVGESSSRHLLSTVERFAVDINAPLQNDWVEAMESLEPHLASGLAFLYHTDKQLFQRATKTLLIWVYAGLDMSVALRQSNSGYIVRHLLAGVRLTGLVTATLDPAIACSLLYPSSAVVDRNSLQFESFQVQHLLLNLLESPLITTPLRLAICRALDQTARLPVGLDAFFGRPCPISYIQPVEQPQDDIQMSCPPQPDEAMQSTAKTIPQQSISPSESDAVVPEEPGVKQEDSPASCATSPKPSETDDGDCLSPPTRTPYQRLVFLLGASKNTRVTSAYQRLLNKLHAYELLLEFHELVDSLRVVKPSDERFTLSLELERKLAYYLNQIAHLVHNARDIIANPRSTLPCPMLLDSDRLSYHDPYPDLCSMVDSTGVLDDVGWIAEHFTDSEICHRSSTSDPESFSQDSVPFQQECIVSIGSGVDSGFVSSPFECLWLSFTDLLSTLLGELNSLTLLASRPEPACRLLLSLLKASSTMNSLEEHTSTALALGLEMAYKLETLRCLDTLINWARKKGVTGTYTAVERLNTDADGRALVEPALTDSLFGLARLCVGSLSSTSLGSSTQQLTDAVKSMLCASAPCWVAEVIGMDDYFAPFLMLLEAFASVGNKIEAKNSDRWRDVTADERGSKTQDSSTEPSSDQAPAPGLRSTLRQILANPLDPAVLLNIVVLSVLRHNEDVAYLERYSPRLARLVSNYIWEDTLGESAAFATLMHLPSFDRSCAPFLHWLRECPTPVSVSKVLDLSQTGSSSAELFSWLVNQLKPVLAELEEALESLLSIETTDELLTTGGGTGTTPQSGRRPQPHQGIMAKYCIPPATLLLLRLLRSHVCEPTGSETLSNKIPERQILLHRSLFLIELFSANGLQKLSTLIQKLSEFFMLHCQTVLGQSLRPIDLVGISTTNYNVSMLFSMLECAVHIVSQLLCTILHAQGSEFRDLTPVRALCQAYACTVYAVNTPGPKWRQLECLRKGVIAGLLAYINTESNITLSVKEIEKSLWVSICREIVAFTVAGPMYYLPGLKILLDLLPLPLPVHVVDPLEDSSQRRIRSARDQWAVHVLALSREFTGLIELLGGTNPEPSNPLYTHLLQLIRRLADLGLPCATLLGSACLDSIFAVWEELFTELRECSATDDTQNSTDVAAMDKPSQPNRLDAGESGGAEGGSPHLSASDASIPLRTPSARLLFHLMSGTDTASDDVPPSFGTRRPDVVKSSSDSAGSDTVSNHRLTELDDSTELSSALSLLHANLQIPACRFVILYLIRQSSPPNRSTPARGPKSGEEGQSKLDLVASRTRMRQFISIAHHILLACSDKPCHVRTQLILLKCIALMVHPDIALGGFAIADDLHDVCSSEEPFESLQLRLVEGLPDVCFLDEIIFILVKHISHPDRDMTTLPSALYPLLLLAQHDYGFAIVRDVLDNNAAQIDGHHFFATMVQRVNDCFSVENPDCQVTLACCLRLLQSLLVGRSTLPLTFAPAESVNRYAAVGLRSLHVSGAKVRDFLGWSGGADEGKAVRDLHALLEMLTDDEPSLEYLRSGMKNLFSLLSEEVDVPECEVSANDVLMLPKPRPIEELFASRPHFVCLSDVGTSASMHRNVTLARQRLSVGPRPVDATDEYVQPKETSAFMVPCNFSKLASDCCGGLNIRAELAKRGRQQDSAEAAIRHQKRRRGHSSIIEMGRSSKKFVAPMRGRGFLLRSSAHHTGASSNSSASSLLGPGGGSCLAGATNRTDPFRSRPLNTSRPPSLHVDDFTKLVKDESVVEDVQRPKGGYRDNRSFRGRGPRLPPNRGGSTGLLPSTAIHTGFPFGLSASALNPLSGGSSLIPSWPPPTRTIPLLPFNLDTRGNQGRRDRPMR